METSAFAQRLAANQQTKRDRSVKKLRKYIAARAAKPGGFSQEELLQLWKGLHYCMWMQDKPLLQEELSGKLCGLLKAFPDADSALAFAAAFFTTQAKEWGRLDQWRMDKFMMLIRDFLHATLEVVQKNRWEGRLVGAVSAMIGEVVDAGKEDYPDGLRLHLADIYLEELEKVGAQELTGDQLSVLLDPFVQYIVNSKRDTIANRVMAKVFLNILATADGGEESGTLQFNFQGLRQVLFDAGRQKSVLPKVRQKIYKMVKRFSELCGEGSPLEGTPLQESVQGKRKRTAVLPSSGEEMEEPEKKKRKSGTEGKKQQPGGTTEVNHKVQPQTPAQQKKKQHKKDTPQSTPRHVAFDLERNSSRDLKDFVDNIHQSSASPYLPTRSPAHGILKDSPGGSTSHTSTPTSGKRGHPVKSSTVKGGSAEKQGGKRFNKGEAAASSSKKHNSVLSAKQKFAVDKKSSKKGGKSSKGEKSSKFVSKKGGKVMKKPKRR